MVKLKVIANNRTEIYETDYYDTINDYLCDLVNVTNGRTTCLWFKDAYGKLVSISPINCIIEAVEIKERNNAS